MGKFDWLNNTISIRSHLLPGEAIKKMHQFDLYSKHLARANFCDMDMFDKEITDLRFKLSNKHGFWESRFKHPNHLGKNTPLFTAFSGKIVPDSKGSRIIVDMKMTAMVFVLTVFFILLGGVLIHFFQEIDLFFKIFYILLSTMMIVIIISIRNAVKRFWQTLFQ